jgi:phosphatidylserine/phosphatidylglycerophosphate/cardiolipin synthase-like enzyme
MPAGLCFTGGVHDASQVTFLSDRTWVDPRGVRHSDLQIFDALFDTIRGARKFVLLDMFYYNDFQRGTPETTRLLSRELTDALLQQKKDYPDMTIVVITDPINTVYGSMHSAQFEDLKVNGIAVITTDLARLRDSNPTYSVFWRLFVKPLGNSEGGFLRNPFDSRTRVTIRGYMALLNYKANHRKVLVADDGDELVGIVSSANPQDASSANDNVAVRFSGPAVADLLASENAVLELCGEKPIEPGMASREQSAGTSVQVLTERAIKTEALEIIHATQPGDRIELAMFFLSDRDVIAALIGASHRGVSTRILLDSNKDSFGRRKYGIPNRPVAAELVSAGIEVRWGHTHGEQCHAKMMLAETASGDGSLLLGSANMTRRNLDNFNLETSALIRASSESEVIDDARKHFDLLWDNTDEQIFSAPYGAYKSESLLRKWLYRFMEASGWSTF